MPRSLRVRSSAPVGWFVAVLVFSATAAAAQITTADVWKKKSAAIQTALKAKKWERVEFKARQLGQFLMDSVVENDAASDAFGLVAAWRAIAHEELGEHEQAEWWWLSACVLSEEIATLDFGVESPGLERLRSLDSDFRGLEASSSDPRLVRPKILYKEAPYFPKNLERNGRVEVFGIVDPSGRLVGPLTVQGTTHAAAKWYAALDAIAHWRVQPATLDGVPTPVIFGFTVEFKVVP